MHQRVNGMESTSLYVEINRWKLLTTVRTRSSSIAENALKFHLS